MCRQRPRPERSLLPEGRALAMGRGCTGSDSCFERLSSVSFLGSSSSRGRPQLTEPLSRRSTPSLAWADLTLVILSERTLPPAPLPRPSSAGGPSAEWAQVRPPVATRSLPASPGALLGAPVSLISRDPGCGSVTVRCQVSLLSPTRDTPPLSSAPVCRRYPSPGAKHHGHGGCERSACPGLSILGGGALE